MKRLLLLTSRIPPTSQVGAVRPGQWAELLPSYGWAVTVAARRHGEDVESWAGADGIPAVRYVIGPRPTQRRAQGLRRIVARANRGLRRNSYEQLRIPDPHLPRWRAAIPKILALAEECSADAVLSTGPPHSLHEIGRVVSQAIGKPWVVDFRDPMVGDPRYGAVGLRQLRHRALEEFEAGLYRDADLVTHAIPAQHAAALARFPEAQARMQFLPNGFAPKLLEYLAQGRTSTDVVSVGRIGKRETSLLIHAFGGLPGEANRLRLVGALPAGAVSLGQRVLGERFSSPGQLPHDEALKAVAESGILVSALGVTRAQVGGLSSRLFEYCATGRPVVAVNPTANDRWLLGQYDASVILERPSVIELQRALVDAMSAKPVGGEALAKLRQRLDRRRGVERLVERLAALTRA